MIFKKEIGCGGKSCTEILKVASPDTKHTSVTLEKPEGISIEREYECTRGHITKVFWYREPKTIFDVWG